MLKVRYNPCAIRYRYEINENGDITEFESLTEILEEVGVEAANLAVTSLRFPWSWIAENGSITESFCCSCGATFDTATELQIHHTEEYWKRTQDRAPFEVL